MRCALALTTLLSALATVQASYLLRRQFPSCAESCLADANFDGCNSSDDTCLCKSSAFVNSVTSCIQSSCTGSDLTTAESDAQQLCLAVGVTLASSGASATSTSPSSSTSSAASSASATSASSGARTHGVNALAGLAAVGAVAFAF